MLASFLGLYEHRVLCAEKSMSGDISSFTIKYFHIYIIFNGVLNEQKRLNLRCKYILPNYILEHKEYSETLRGTLHQTLAFVIHRTTLRTRVVTGQLAIIFSTYF